MSDGQPAETGSGGSPLRRSAIVPTARGTVVLALGAGVLAIALWARYPGLVAIGLGLLGACAVTAVALLMSKPPTVERVVPEGAVVRLEPAGAELVVGLPAGTDPRDIAAQETIDGELVDIPADPGAGGRRHVIPLSTALPGEVTLGPFRVHQHSIARLWRLSWRDDETAQVVVVPRRLPLRLPPTGALPVITTAADRLEGSGTDVRALREYVQGDDLRRVSAYASARYGKLIVREDGEPSIISLAVLVDDDPAHPVEEYAEMLDCAASITSAAGQQGLPCTWATRGGLPQVIDEGSIEAGVREMALRERSSEPLPRASAGDFTVLITATGGDPLELMQSVAAHGDHRVLTVIAISSDGRSITDQIGSAVTAATAEDALRTFVQVGRFLASA